MDKKEGRSVEVDLNERSCSSHLFRHASEITKETKGGYLEGEILINADVTFPVYARLCLLPSSPFEKDNPFMLHPNLLHVNMKLNKRKRKLEEGDLPEDVDWMVLIKIDTDGTVYRVCGTSSDPSKRFQHAKEISSYANSQAAIQGEGKLKEMYADRFEERLPWEINLGPLFLPIGQEILKPITKVQHKPDGIRYIELGNRGLMLNVITPLQKFSRGGATISDVLRQRFHDVFQREMSNDLLMKSEEIFTKSKEFRVKLQLVRLLFEVFNSDLSFKTADFSQIITNSKSKECGPLQLSDINPNTSCTKGNAKVFLLSFFKLVQDVRPAFILVDDSGNVPSEEIEILRKKIIQPEVNQSKVFNQSVIIFRTPSQDLEVMNEIRSKKLQIRITAYRPSDGRMSSTSFPFFYRNHNSSDDLGDSDSESDENQESLLIDSSNPNPNKCLICELFKYSDTKSLPLAKPGVHRRKNEVLKYEEALKVKDDPKMKKDKNVENQQESGYRPKKLKVLQNVLAMKEEVIESNKVSAHLTMPCPAPRTTLNVTNQANWSSNQELYVNGQTVNKSSSSSSSSSTSNYSNGLDLSKTSSTHLLVRPVDYQHVPMNLSKRPYRPLCSDPLSVHKGVKDFSLFKQRAHLFPRPMVVTASTLNGMSSAGNSE